LKDIGSYQFCNTTKPSGVRPTYSISLPASLEKIGKKIFYDGGNIATFNITFNSTIPPIANEGNPFHSGSKQVHIFVPKGTLSAYQTA